MISLIFEKVKNNTKARYFGAGFFGEPGFAANAFCELPLP